MRYSNIIVAVSMVVVASCLSRPAQAQEKPAPPQTATEKAKAAEPFFGNSRCVVTGEKTTPTAFVEYKNPATKTYARIYMCCPMCKETIEKDPAAAYKKAYLDRELKDKDGKVLVAKGQPIALSNPKCPVEGGKISGKDFIVYNGYRIDFCCPGCDKTFLKDADKNLAKLIKEQKLQVPGLPEPAARAESPAAEPLKP